MLNMDRRGAEDSPPLPSQHLSSGAQQSTLLAYCEMLGDFVQKAPFQTSGKGLMTCSPLPLSIVCFAPCNAGLYFHFSSKTAAPLNVPPERLSVDRTSNNQPQPSGGIKSDDRDNISDSGATTTLLAHDELENLPYWYEAQQVEKSLRICHVGDKVWRNNKYVHRVLYVVETYLPDNWLPENARLQLQKQEEKQRRRKKEMQRKKRLSTLRPRSSTRN
ncbi:hypothetical protein I7I53_07000 [Histoplasma capsulatum var. duboisii H88]|uniref:Uncharacterized protein n=2 Tax=Ajellomyces capsulatus TaxID=5037 RepID=A0A8A1LG78_AJEC8|nr:conserved hypothetical protein [Histoplasma capsulatum H143]QSS51633.1 hypothetical protein I7I53_07000 [Histoplasma capsulatum var. duboisii H88]